MKPPPSPPPRLGCALEVPGVICKGSAKAGTTNRLQRIAAKQKCRMALNSLRYARAGPHLPARRVPAPRHCWMIFPSRRGGEIVCTLFITSWFIFYEPHRPIVNRTLPQPAGRRGKGGNERHIKPQRLVLLGELVAHLLIRDAWPSRARFSASNRPRPCGLRK